MAINTNIVIPAYINGVPNTSGKATVYQTNTTTGQTTTREFSSQAAANAAVNPSGSYVGSQATYQNVGEPGVTRETSTGNIISAPKQVQPAPSYIRVVTLPENKGAYTVDLRKVGLQTGTSNYGGGVVAPGYTVENGKVVPVQKSKSEAQKIIEQGNLLAGIVQQVSNEPNRVSTAKTDLGVGLNASSQQGITGGTQPNIFESIWGNLFGKSETIVSPQGKPGGKIEVFGATVTQSTEAIKNNGESSLLVLPKSATPDFGWWQPLYAGMYMGVTSVPFVGGLFGSGIDVLQGKQVTPQKLVSETLLPRQPGQAAERYQQGLELYGAAPSWSRDLYKSAVVLEAGFAGGYAAVPAITAGGLTGVAAGSLSGASMLGTSSFVESTLNKETPTQIMFSTAAGATVGAITGGITAKLFAKPSFETIAKYAPTGNTTLARIPGIGYAGRAYTNVSSYLGEKGIANLGEKGFVSLTEKSSASSGLRLLAQEVQSNPQWYSIGFEAFRQPGLTAEILQGLNKQVLRNNIINLGEAGRINFNGGFGGLYGSLGTGIKSAATSPLGKEVIRFVGTQALSQGLYYTSSQTVPTVRNIYASQNKYYTQQEDVVNVIGEGYGLGYVRASGGKVPLVDEAGAPILDDKGIQQYETYAPTITGTFAPLETFLVGSIPPLQAVNLGKGGLFGSGFFSEETFQARIGGLEEKIKTTKSYKTSPNQEQFLKEAINVEFFGGQVGGALAIPQYESASELGISSLGRVVTPTIMRQIPGRTGLATSMAVITPPYGGMEAYTTNKINAESMRMKTTSEQDIMAALSGSVMATTINVATGATFFKAKTPFITTGTTASKAVYYGAKGVGYGFDIPEFFVDKALGGAKNRLGINIGVSTMNFAGAPSPGTITTTRNVPSSGKIIVPDSGNILGTNNNTDVISDDVVGNVISSTDTKGNTNNFGAIDTSTKNFFGGNTSSTVNTSSTINTALNSITQTTASVSTIVAPNVPLFPFLGLPASDAFGGKQSGRKRTKYYNELDVAIGEFKGFNFLKVPKRGRRKILIGQEYFYLGKRVKRKAKKK